VVALGLAISGRMSVGSLLGAVAFPILCWIFEPKFVWIGLIMAIIVIVKHRANIKRLLKGEEPRLFKKDGK
jgi:glycerol-3-phosphate acyltransferase PlsY